MEVQGDVTIYVSRDFCDLEGQVLGIRAACRCTGLVLQNMDVFYQLLIWRFPEIGVALNHPFVDFP